MTVFIVGVRIVLIVSENSDSQFLTNFLAQKTRKNADAVGEPQSFLYFLFLP